MKPVRSSHDGMWHENHFFPKALSLRLAQAKRVLLLSAATVFVRLAHKLGIFVFRSLEAIYILVFVIGITHYP